jgi:hypothetical protein
MVVGAFSYRAICVSTLFRLALLVAMDLLRLTTTRVFSTALQCWNFVLYWSFLVLARGNTTCGSLLRRTGATLVAMSDSWDGGSVGDYFAEALFTMGTTMLLGGAEGALSPTLRA